jgi:hypothetical protein
MQLCGYWAPSLEGLNEEIELQTVGPGLDNQNAGQLFNSLNRVPKPSNLLYNLGKLLTSGVTLLNTHRPIFQQYRKPGFPLSRFAPVGISIRTNSDHGAAIPTSTPAISSPKSTTSSATMAATSSPPSHLPTA